MWVSIVSHPIQNLVWFIFLICAIGMWYIMYIIIYMELWFAFSESNAIEYYLICFFAYRCIFRIIPMFCPFLIEVFFFIIDIYMCVYVCVCVCVCKHIHLILKKTQVWIAGVDRYDVFFNSKYSVTIILSWVKLWTERNCGSGGQTVSYTQIFKGRHP